MLSITYDNIALKINGQPTPVKPTENPMNGNGTIVDISKQDAVIELSITGSKSHVGACCFRPAEYQSLSLFVNTTYNFQSEVISKLAAPKIVKAMVGNGYWFKEFAFIQYPRDLKFKISESLNTGQGDYRDYFYPTLLFLRTMLDGQLKDSMAITKIVGLKDYISNEIGRKLILPTVASKIGAYENASVVKTEDDFNLLYRNILKIANSQNQSKDDVKNKLRDVLFDQGDQSSEMKNAAKALIENIDQALSMDNIQNEINTYMASVKFSNQKILAEIKLLKREKYLLEQR